MATPNLYPPKPSPGTDTQQTKRHALTEIQEIGKTFAFRLLALRSGGGAIVRAAIGIVVATIMVVALVRRGAAAVGRFALEQFEQLIQHGLTDPSMKDGEIRKQKAPAHPQNGQGQSLTGRHRRGSMGVPDRRHRVMTIRNRYPKAAWVTPSVATSLSGSPATCQPRSRSLDHMKRNC